MSMEFRNEHMNKRIFRNGVVYKIAIAYLGKTLSTQILRIVCPARPSHRLLASHKAVDDVSADFRKILVNLVQNNFYFLAMEK